MDSLPQEVVDMIVEELYSDNQYGRTATRNCSLSSRTLRYASLRCIFRTVAVSQLIETRNLNAFTRVILTAPYITQCIRKLSLWGVEITLDELCNVLSKLTQLDEMMLLGIDLDSGAHLPDTRKFSLRSLTIGWVYPEGRGARLHRLLGIFRTVRDLTLSNIRQAIFLASDTPSKSAVPSLDWQPTSLTLKRPTIPLLTFVERNMTSCETLTLMQIDCNEFPLVGAVLSQFAATLTELRLGGQLQNYGVSTGKFQHIRDDVDTNGHT
jgi:hypothetical protein